MNASIILDVTLHQKPADPVRPDHPSIILVTSGPNHGNALGDSGPKFVLEDPIDRTAGDNSITVAHDHAVAPVGPSPSEKSRKEANGFISRADVISHVLNEAVGYPSSKKTRAGREIHGVDALRAAGRAGWQARARLVRDCSSRNHVR